MSDEDLNRTRDDWVSENALLGGVLAINISERFDRLYFSLLAYF